MTPIRKTAKLCLLIFGALVLLLTLGATTASADSFTLSGPATFSGQGKGAIYILLDLQHNGTEKGAVAPTNATNLAWLNTNYGPCSVHSGVEQCGNSTNNSNVVTGADLTALGITNASQFGLLYNVNQNTDLNTYLYAPSPFTVYFYGATGNVLFSGSYAGTNDPFPPALKNGQGTAGWLFTFDGTEDMSTVVAIGMAGKISNSNDGSENWSVVNAGGANPVPEPASIALFGTGLVGLAAMLRRRRKAA